MRTTAKVLGVTAALSAFASVAFFALGIWSQGQLAQNFVDTGFLAFAVTAFTGLGAAVSAEL